MERLQKKEREIHNTINTTLTDASDFMWVGRIHFGVKTVWNRRYENVLHQIVAVSDSDSAYVWFLAMSDTYLSAGSDWKIEI